MSLIKSHRTLIVKNFAMKYRVHIEETLAKDVVIEATSYKDAQNVAHAMLDNEEIVLTADDYTGERFVEVL